MNQIVMSWLRQTKNLELYIFLRDLPQIVLYSPVCHCIEFALKIEIEKNVQP